MPPWCKIQVYLLCRSITCLKQVSKGLKNIKWTTHWGEKSGLTLTFEHVTWNSIGIIYSLSATPAPSLVLIKWRGQKILSGQHSGLRRVIDLDLWTCDLKIKRDHLLIECNPCTKFDIDQVKGSKDIYLTTQWAKKSGLTLTFKHVTWKSIGIIYSSKQFAPFFKGGGGG